MTKLLEDFAQFYCENADKYLENWHFLEVGPQLLLMGFLLKVVNGGGSVNREYPIGSKKCDLMVKFGSN